MPWCREGNRFGRRRLIADPSPFRLGRVGGCGPAVLCLHGLTGTPYEVRRPAELLAQEGFACMAPLLPGHGGDHREIAKAGRREWRAAIEAAWDELAATHDRVYVLGLSLGGLLALTLAARRPVAAAAVLASPIDLGPWIRGFLPLVSRVIDTIPRRKSIFDEEARARHPGADRMPLAAVRELVDLCAEVKQELARVVAPLSLVYSRRDPTVHFRNAEQIASRVSSEICEVLYLENSSHVITVDREKDRVARRVVEFFVRQDRLAALDEEGGNPGIRVDAGCGAGES